MDRLRIAFDDGRIQLPHGTSARDLVSVRQQLEATFLIRIWAEFETAVRAHYGWIQGDPNVRIRAKDLIDTVAASRRGRAVGKVGLDEVHAIREYRNSLVHDRDEPATEVRLSDARRSLNYYLWNAIEERWDSD